MLHREMDWAKVSSRGGNAVSSTVTRSDLKSTELPDRATLHFLLTDLGLKQGAEANCLSVVSI